MAFLSSLLQYMILALLELPSIACRTLASRQSFLIVHPVHQRNSPCSSSLPLHPAHVPERGKSCMVPVVCLSTEHFRQEVCRPSPLSGLYLLLETVQVS